MENGGSALDGDPIQLNVSSIWSRVGASVEWMGGEWDGGNGSDGKLGLLMLIV